MVVPVWAIVMPPRQEAKRRAERAFSSTAPFCSRSRAALQVAIPCSAVRSLADVARFAK